ncbi:uncharacterized protein LOC100680523 [Nasonia vitripennis]|uniref:Uncharacterized protein n=1 Tax=Nasonia vitripennis TaxID=7425 RepID=A0A7M7LNK6_NASVI|nr:uncharacterized protein LOC100680523 [Nasonia vitripennis]
MSTNHYKKEIDNIVNYAKKNNISEEQVNKIFNECFYLLETKSSSRLQFILKFIKWLTIISFLLITSGFVLYNHPKTHNILLRNVQNLIYPGLRIFRKFAVPVITVYPSLTEWYDEWCLLENPYFEVSDMDCWPCNSVNSVQDLTGYNVTSTFNTGIPFIRIEKTETVDIKELYKTYVKYQDVFRIDAALVSSNKLHYRTIDDVMQTRLDLYPFSNGSTHIEWRINRMEPGRKLRELFPKLPGIPDWWNPSMEKYIFIDEPKSDSYSLPNPECANVIIQCTSGERLIELNPSPECTRNCQKLKVLLTSHQSLWYNWWYWRPISTPSNTTAITVMYVTSFC